MEKKRCQGDRTPGLRLGVSKPGGRGSQASHPVYRSKLWNKCDIWSLRLRLSFIPGTPGQVCSARERCFRQVPRLRWDGIVAQRHLPIGQTNISQLTCKVRPMGKREMRNSKLRSLDSQGYSNYHFAFRIS